MRGLGTLVLLLCALSPVARAQAPPQSAIDSAIERGAKRLLMDFTRPAAMEPGRRALVAYALLKSGVDPSEPKLAAALTHLALEDVQGTYAVACTILALSAHDPRGHEGAIRALARTLVETQNPKGDWGYPSGADLSNTQYAALGLWAASRAGIELDPQVWRDLADAVKGYRSSNGGFGYRDGSSATGSMTTAGAGVLAICRSMLAEEAMPPRERRAQDQAIDRGAGWLDEHWSVEDNPRAGSTWHYYYLYGLERLGALADLGRIGDHDWYGEGAKVLVSQQKRGGGWGDPVQTSFALLFLRRATRPTTGPTLTRSDHQVTKKGKGPVRLVAKGESPLQLWLVDWNEKELGELIREGEQGQGPRVVRVDYVAGQLVLGSVAGASGVPAGEERFELEHHFRAPGEYTIHARVQLMGPRRKDAQGRLQAGEIRTLQTLPITVRVDAVLPSWLADQRSDGARNLLADVSVEARASSVWKGGKGVPRMEFTADFAVDGRLGRAWLADPGDDKRTLTLELAKPVRADVVLISSPRSSPHRIGYFGRPLEVEVRINDGKPRKVRMHLDERRKGRLELEQRVRIRTLELRVPFVVPGEVAPATGIGEVELLDSSK